MKSVWKMGISAFLILAVLMSVPFTSKAVSDGIREGIYAGEIELSGLSASEAQQRIEAYVQEMAQDRITLVAAGGHEVTVTASDLGLYWANPEILTEAEKLGREGNIIQRYKTLKALKVEKKVYEIRMGFDIGIINDVLVEQCRVFDQKPVDAGLVRENGQFRVIEGKTGYELDVEASIDEIYSYLVNEWNGGDCRIDLSVAVEEPRGNAQELSEVKDLLGTYTTDFSSSNSNRSGNVSNGCSKINGTLLYPGDEFSTTDTVSPFTAGNGYALAGAYLNGKVVNSIGGGICQVSTTLYNAVLRAELSVTERFNHSMSVNYVAAAADAAIAESSGKDFKFVNNTDYPIYIEGYTENKKITFNVYGKETRPANRQVEYESEILEVINPASDLITADSGKPLGYITTEAAHIGYKARLIKIVKEDGVEVSRQVVNNSKYNVSPRSAVVGVATEDSHKYEEIMAAIGTGNVDHVRNVIALLTQPEPEGEQ